MDVSVALSPHPDGVVIALEVSPNAKKDLFPDGVNPWRRTVGCTVTPSPVDGRANRAVLALVAEVLGAKKGEVELLTGATSSLKRVLVRRTTMMAVATALSHRTAGSHRP
ncbi:MAG: hypothetical protein GXY82_08325 [Methanospirillum sp.]|nr:hypothetical protein [Methanospirillum sp.]